MKVRIVYRPDKSVAVIHPAPESRRENETKEEWLKRVFDKAMTQPQDRLEGLPYDDVEKSELPLSREDRNAWEGEKGSGIKVNVEKAKGIRDEKERETKIKDKMRKIAIRELGKE